MNYHLIGIGGIGMSGLARLLQNMHLSVSGSDSQESETTHHLRALGIPISIGHDAKNVPLDSKIVFSSGISVHNPELIQAKNDQFEILHRSDLLHELMHASKALLVTGTHGKTTTSSLLAAVLLHAHLKPSYAIGGVLLESGANASKGSGEYFVAEADESDGSFLRYEPYGAIITNIGHDHMDFYKSEEGLLKAFKTFGEKTSSKKHLFFCSDNDLVRSCNFLGVSYGFHAEAELKGSRFRQEGWNSFFDADFENSHYADIEVALTGEHNASNALAVFGMALRLGIDEKTIREALREFKGVKRRAELKGEVHQIQIRDDYGHHPTEIKATLRAIKNAAPTRRLVVLFQPHRYSRTRDCLQLFGSCFDSADLVFVTDIYGAGEPPIEAITARLIIDEIKKTSSVSVHPFHNNVEAFLRPFDTLVTIGAGDIWKEGEKLLHKLQNQVSKINVGIVFGGKSLEHEISLRSVSYILEEMDRAIFEMKLFYISKSGNWSEVVEIPKVPDDQATGYSVPPEVLASLQGCDIVFPMLHGPNGEDGTLQGFFDMLDIPYAGCNHKASAICMDKAITKKLAQSAGLKVAPSIDFSLYDWNASSDVILKKIEDQLSFPLYVKPVHLGSTIGVKKVETKDSLIEAVIFAFKYDYHLLVEEEIKGRELEFAILGSEKIVIFPPGEILAEGLTYDYEAKYSSNSFQVASKAKLEEALVKKGMAFAKAAYKAAGCDGFARVDCFLDEDNQFLLNEINPLPGFTKNSLYPQICAANKLSLSDLLKELICIGLCRHRLKGRLRG